MNKGLQLNDAYLNLDQMGFGNETNERQPFSC